MKRTPEGATVNEGAALFVLDSRERTCPMAEQTGESDLDALIRSGISNPIAIGLAESLLREAGIPFFVMNQSTAPRQDSGNVLGWWDIRVPGRLETSARAILRSVEEMK
jgi:hypothetical protein